MISVR
jgi:RNA polymerase sigma factor (sigma-70 family)